MIASESAPDPPSYIRGGAGVATTDRRVGRIAAAMCLAALAVTIVALVVSGISQDRQHRGLVSHGVPVALRVTGCVALASGTGMTTDGYSCRGTYALGDQRFNEPLRATTAYYPTGETIDAVADSSRPTVVAPAAVLKASRSRLAPFLAPGLLLVVLVGATVGLRRWWRRDS